MQELKQKLKLAHYMHREVINISTCVMTLVIHKQKTQCLIEIVMAKIDEMLGMQKTYYQ